MSARRHTSRERTANDDADLLYRHLANGEGVSTGDRTVPWVVFTGPQVGHVGPTERRPTRRYEMGISRQDFADQGKPKALGIWSQPYDRS